MEKVSAEKKIPVLILAKCLLFSCLLTAVLLLLLAFFLLKLGLTEGMVSIAVSGIYASSTFLGGFLAGKRLLNRKFLWGFLVGAAYFILLLVLSLLTGGVPDDSALTTMIICTAAGTMGGMLS